jgi:hypothetical protein
VLVFSDIGLGIFIFGIEIARIRLVCEAGLIFWIIIDEAETWNAINILR